MKPINHYTEDELDERRDSVRYSLPMHNMCSMIESAIKSSSGLVVRSLGDDVIRDIPLTSEHLIEIANNFKSDVMRAKSGKVTEHFYEVMFIGEFKWSHMSCEELEMEMRGTAWGYKFEQDE